MENGTTTRNNDNPLEGTMSQPTTTIDTDTLRATIISLQFSARRLKYLAKDANNAGLRTIHLQDAAVCTDLIAKINTAIEAN